MGSVSASTANSLKVTFNTPVADTTKANFSVKVGGSVVAVQPATWNADKTEATLVKSVGKLAAGDYTVSVTGLTDVALTGTATVAAEVVNGVEIVGSNLVQASNGQTGTVVLKVTNQYGEDITKSLANADITATVSASGASAVFDHTTGLITVDPDTLGSGTFTSKTISKLTLTVIYNATGKNVAKELTVSDAARVGTFTVDQPVLPTGTTQFVQGTGYVLPVTAADQYGTAITFAQAADTNATGLTFVSSASEVSNFQVNADGKITFDIGSVSTTKDVTITVVNPATGDSKPVTFRIYAPAVADTATLTTPTSKFTTDYNGAPTYLVPISLVDQYGNKLTDDQVVAAASGLTIVSTNPGVFTVGSVTKDSNLGAVVNLTAVSKGAASLVITVNGSAKTVTLPLTVVDPVVPVAFSVSPSATNLTVGATSTVKAAFLDSDGVAVTSADSHYKIHYSVATADASKVDIGVDTTVANAISTGTAITAKADAAGKAVTVTATLYKDTAANGYDSGEEVDTKTFTLNVAATNATFTYALKDIPTLHATLSNGLSSEYAKTLELTATDASGNVVTIPQSRIVGATSSNPSVAAVGIDSGVYKVVGNNVATAGTPSTATITILVEDNDGTVKTVQKTVTVSDEALVAQTIDAYEDSDTTYGTPLTEYTVADGGSDGTRNDLATGLKVAGTDAAGDSNFQFVIIDQFGGHSLTPSTYAVTGTDEFIFGSGESLEVDSAGTDTLKLASGSDTEYDSNAVFTVTAVTANGLAKSINVKVASGAELVAPDADGGSPVTVTHTSGSANLIDGETVAFKFSEKLSTTSQADVITALQTALGGSTKVDVATTDGITFTATVKVGQTIDTTGGLYISIDKTKVIDLSGNAAGTTGDITFSIPEQS